MPHSYDNFLSDVTTFREADRAIYDAGLERNGVAGHVDAKSRHARFNPERFVGLTASRRDTRVGQLLSKAICFATRQVDVISRYAKRVVFYDRERIGREIVVAIGEI